MDIKHLLMLPRRQRMPRCLQLLVIRSVLRATDDPGAHAYLPHHWLGLSRYVRMLMIGDVTWSRWFQSLRENAMTCGWHAVCFGGWHVQLEQSTLAIRNMRLPRFDVRVQQW
jgi:hypothetical protein